MFSKLQDNRRKHYEGGNFFAFADCTTPVQYICLTDKECQIELAYVFLEELKSLVESKFTPEQISKSLNLGVGFNEEVKQLVSRYNQNQISDKAKELIKQLSGLKNEVAENLS